MDPKTEKPEDQDAECGAWADQSAECCDWCHLGYSPEDEDLVYDEKLDMIFHKLCYEDFKGQVERAVGHPIFWGFPGVYYSIRSE
jgi:hypothetical protein